MAKIKANDANVRARRSDGGIHKTPGVARESLFRADFKMA
jgi:hypothetical protein